VCDLRVDDHLWRLERGRLNEGEVGVAHELAREPEEGLLEVVVGLGRDVVVLQVLLPVEGDLLGLDLESESRVGGKGSDRALIDACVYVYTYIYIYIYIYI